MFKKGLVAFGVAVTCLAGTLGAQENATVVLRSGDRVAGELLDHGAAGFAMRVNGQGRTIPTDEVATIEFAPANPPSGETLERLRAGRHVIVLKSGQVVEGRFADIGGSRPLRITMDTPNGQRDFSSGDVAQVILAATGGAVATTGAANAVTEPSRAALAAGAVQVSAKTPWTDTGLRVERGDRVSFTAEGNVAFSPSSGHVAGPDGNSGVPSPNLPVASMPVGGLIARVGNSAPFPIGSNTQPIAMPADGRLMIGINDTIHEDNSGAFTVAVRRQRR